MSTCQAEYAEIRYVFPGFEGFAVKRNQEMNKWLRLRYSQDNLKVQLMNQQAND